MEFETSTLMMVFFIIAVIVSFWKIYAFLPNRQLADDDTTEKSQAELTKLMLRVIKENRDILDVNELFVQMQCSEDFDAKRYWRFNLNKLNQLLSKHYLQNPNVKNITDIYKSLK